MGDGLRSAGRVVRECVWVSTPCDCGSWYRIVTTEIGMVSDCAWPVIRRVDVECARCSGVLDDLETLAADLMAAGGVERRRLAATIGERIAPLLATRQVGWSDASREQEDDKR